MDGWREALNGVCFSVAIRFISDQVVNWRQISLLRLRIQNFCVWLLRVEFRIPRVHAIQEQKWKHI